MKNITLGARILLGAAFVTFGLNHWLEFIPMGGPKPPELASQFIGALVASGFLTFVKVLEVLGGAALLSKRFAPVGLAILGPIVANILLYDLFLAKAFNPVGFLVLVLEVFLIWSYRRNFLGIFEGPKI